MLADLSIASEQPSRPGMHDEVICLMVSRSVPLEYISPAKRVLHDDARNSFERWVSRHSH
jgi:hypothetical protein